MIREGYKIPVQMAKDALGNEVNKWAQYENIYTAYSPEQRKVLFPWLPAEVEQTTEDIAKPDTQTIKDEIESQVDLFKKSLASKQKTDEEKLGSKLASLGLTYSGAQEARGSELAQEYGNLLSEGESKIRVSGQDKITAIEQDAYNNAADYLKRLRLMQAQDRMNQENAKNNVSVVYGGTNPSTSTTPEALADQKAWFQKYGNYGGYASEDEMNAALAKNGMSAPTVYKGSKY